MTNIAKKRIARSRRRGRVRVKLSGTRDCPRFSIFRSGRHIYAQLIDDVSAKTLLSASTLKLLPTRAKKTIEAHALGIEFAKVAIKQGFSKVAFDRGGYAYHGRVKALAEGARIGGLEF